MNIRLHVERLVLDGLPVSSSQSPQVKAAVEAELTRLLTANGLSHELRGGGAVPHIRAGGLEVGANRSPVHLGNQIAQSVYGGIGKAR